MTINEQINILDNKIRSNQAQYDLVRQNATISALSSGELDKYEYLTGEDLGYKPDVVQKAKFEYSPLGQVFHKELDTGGKQEGLLKRLKNIEGKNEQRLHLIRDKGDRQLEKFSKVDIDGTKYIEIFSEKNKKKELKDYREIVENENEDKEFLYTTTSNKIYDFSVYKMFFVFIKK